MGSFSEEIARTYFQQMITTIEFLHDQGIVHRDIKPDNLLLDSDFMLKMADFTFSRFILNDDDSNLQRQYLGTPNYLAPEILSSDDYLLQAVDIFSCGVILFLMVVGNPPFGKAHSQDLYYRFIIKNQYSQFWKQVERHGRTFSDEFKSLLNGMLCLQPTERLTIAEIKEHPWYNGKTCSIDELKAEYEKKKANLIAMQDEKNKQMQKAKEEKEAKKKIIEAKMPPSIASFNCFGMKGINIKNRGGLEEIIDREILKQNNRLFEDVVRTNEENNNSSSSIGKCSSSSSSRDNIIGEEQ
jgi:serine/threonine protein kinase